MIQKVFNIICNLRFSINAWYIFILFNFIKGKCSKSSLLINNCHSSKFIWNKKSTIQLKGRLKLREKSKIEIHENASLIINGDVDIFQDATITCLKGSLLTIGSGFINTRSHILTAKEIHIGKDCAIGCDVIIRDYDFHYLDRPGYQVMKPINIGNHVWIGQRAMILKGVTIGDGSIIAAGAIVTHDVPANCIAAGIPAKVIQNNIHWKM